MAVEVSFSFSDSVAGYVVRRQGRTVELRTIDGRGVTIHLTDVTYAQQLRNLGQSFRDATGRLDELLLPGAFLFSYGPVYPRVSGLYFQAAQLIFIAEPDALAPFEEAGWWTAQLRASAHFYRKSQFGTRPVNFTDYQTEIGGSGEKIGGHVQESDTLSRLIYGMATAYMLTGEEDFLDVAEQGSRYMHDNLRFVDDAEDIAYWLHGIDIEGPREHQFFASEFSDDYRAIAAYEQIYALVGLVQAYRVTGDPRILSDIENTVSLFDRFFADPQLGGYYSHIDPVTLSPHHESLGPNRSRKNWNSVGDHAPAYLFNLFLATGDDRYRRMLEHTFDMIVAHLPDRSDERSPFAYERFHADWTPDRTWGWQRDRAVIGHNLKIAWNLMRMHAAMPKPEYLALAQQIGRSMPTVGRDSQRGGWYDMVERIPEQGQHPFIWHDRKIWWQQEQAILAYLVLAGHTREAEFLRHAREAAAFYNAFFLDHDDGAVHFTVLAEGLPYHVGNERLKGNHSMSMYHMAELCYLAEVYTRLLVHRDPLDLWFRPRADASYPQGKLRVAPDVLPRGSVVLDSVRIDGAPYADFDPKDMTVALPDSDVDLTVQVRLRPIAKDLP